MTTQEAKLKHDIPRKQIHNYYSELYFPSLRSNIFSLMTGDQEIIETVLKRTYPNLESLNKNYIAAKNEQQLTTDVPLQLEFVDQGLSFELVVREQTNQDEVSHVTYFQYQILNWQTDKDLLIILAKALNEMILQCTRRIPTLIRDSQNFRNISLIETNPVYEYMALVYSLYKSLNMVEALPACYIQTLMARKRVSYNMLCHTLKYSINLPESVKTWFDSNDIVREQIFKRKIPSINANIAPDNKIENELVYEFEESKQWALHLIDYAGLKFSQKLQFQFSRKRVYDNDRYVNIDGDKSVTGDNSFL